MNKFIVLKGDGIGPEIMDSALKVLDKATKIINFDYEYKEFDFGGASIDKFDLPFNRELKNEIKNYNAILLASIGGPKWSNLKNSPEKGLLELRKYLNVYANIRPVKVNAKLAELSPLKADLVKGVDLVIVRELISGIYFGKPKYRTSDEALDSMKYKREEIERIVDFAFKLAQKRNKKLTSVDKANVLETSKLWREIVNEISKKYCDVVVEHMYVDAAAMALITKAQAFDVIVTENLFGDILSDEASVLAGSLGMLSSESIGDKISLYEPAHGSAPDIANKNIANPSAMILSMTSMLRNTFNQEKLANLIDDALFKTINSGMVTKDLNEKSYLTLSEFTDKVIENL